MSDLSSHDKAVLNCIFNPSLPLTEAHEEELTSRIEDVEDDTDETKRAKAFEAEAVDRAEKGDLENALNILNEALRVAPNKASLYNNRAQIYQLKFLQNEAFADLTRAIDLARDRQNRTLCQALCQRGLLHRKRDQADLAREDFQAAAKLGSPFAKSQLIELNPYAALCNQMLRKVMSELN